MPRAVGITAFPFLKPPEDWVEATPWTNPDGRKAFPDGIFRDWDPATNIELTRRVSLRTATLEDDCFVRKQSRICICASWYSPGTNLRGRGGSRPSFELLVPSECENETLGITVPGTHSAQKIIILTQVVMIDPGPTPATLSPTLPGTVLWEDRKEVAIEGDGSRFPIEFVELPWQFCDAAWELDIKDNLYLPFLGAVRLRLNKRNRTISRLINSGELEASDMSVLSMLYYDVGRQMINKALTKSFLEECKKDPGGWCPFPKDTLGHTLRQLIDNFFHGEPLAGLIDKKEANPEGFDTWIQHTMKLFSEDTSK